MLWICASESGAVRSSHALILFATLTANPQDPPVLHLPESIETLPTVFVIPDRITEARRQCSVPVTASGDSSPSLYPVVALGGTFDHLHAGHKILLSMAAWIASSKVIVGVTGMKIPCNVATKLILLLRRRAAEE